ncbi:uncharacterized protein PAC_10942 [Phialocephala subalpina]|uniref:NmrA-like domain-containing protein n=1 Tax=Phialocephala subalpina TaxID=576137 RepID=A0A1L7X7Q7_9HELO|nr:uncharacterized protein PAC_10942 [Phialocephala subalpina]
MTDRSKFVGNPTARDLVEHFSDLFRVRAVTRDPTKDAARELQKLGAEVVAADFDNEASLVAAFEWANAIFAITNSWDKLIMILKLGKESSSAGLRLRCQIWKFLSSAVCLMGERQRVVESRTFCHIMRKLPSERISKGILLSPRGHRKLLGIEARFEQVSPADHKKRMTDSCLPEHLAVCVTELSENLMFGGKTLSAEKLIIPPGYSIKPWQDYVKKED